MHKSRRQCNFELLRILAMFMVVVMHYVSRSQALPEYGGQTGAVGITAVFLEAFCLVAVNVYVLISGYFLSQAAFSWKRIGRLYAQVLCYTVLIPPVLWLLGALPLAEISHLYFLAETFFPVITGHYWFVSAYLVLCVFHPFLNAGLDKLSQKQLKQLLAVLLLYFSLGKTLLPLHFPTDKWGYDFGWFLVLYLIGGYIRRYGIPFFKNGVRGFGIYLGAMGLTGVLECVTVYGRQWARAAGMESAASVLDSYAEGLFHYNHLLCLLGAVGLFYGFFYLRIREGRLAAAIRFVSPAVFGVYLIHEQQQVAGRWFGWVNGLTGKLGPFFRQEPGVFPYGVFGFLVLLLLHTLLVFFIGIIIDKIREAAFAGLLQARQRKNR